MNNLYILFFLIIILILIICAIVIQNIYSSNKIVKGGAIVDKCIKIVGIFDIIPGTININSLIVVGKDDNSTDSNKPFRIVGYYTKEGDYIEYNKEDYIKTYPTEFNDIPDYYKIPYLSEDTGLILRDLYDNNGTYLIRIGNTISASDYNNIFYKKLQNTYGKDVLTDSGMIRSLYDSDGKKLIHYYSNVPASTASAKASVSSATPLSVSTILDVNPKSAREERDITTASAKSSNRGEDDRGKEFATVYAKLSTRSEEDNESKFTTASAKSSNRSEDDKSSNREPGFPTALSNARELPNLPPVANTENNRSFKTVFERKGENSENNPYTFGNLTSTVDEEMNRRKLYQISLRDTADEYNTERGQIVDNRIKTYNSSFDGSFIDLNNLLKKDIDYRESELKDLDSRYQKSNSNLTSLQSGLAKLSDKLKQDQDQYDKSDYLSDNLQITEFEKIQQFIDDNDITGFRLTNSHYNLNGKIYNKDDIIPYDEFQQIRDKLPNGYILTDDPNTTYYHAAG